jgi:peptidoglycan hydrolase CwlO-like protein
VGAFDFTWNAIQSGQLRELEEKVEALTKDMETARLWIDYLQDEIVKLKSEIKNG